jgi:serine/threonine protein kinase, bacterial
LIRLGFADISDTIPARALPQTQSRFDYFIWETQQMAPIYCTRGHLNAPENKFCSSCGEKLAGVAQPGSLLGGRYRIIKALGHGGFGRTYLAEDIHRFNETCVLKEFAPQVQGSYELEKAEELFAREAGVLYKLNHPQIPRFRELFRANLDEQERLFLVQDYVEGRTYRQLLEARKSQELHFSELEIRQLFVQLLPVLQYLHNIGVIHRDISPDNLILRSLDQQPVLIDFGGVKQVAAAATSAYVNPSAAETAVPLTRLGKAGYAPPEQMHQGMVSPESDLYALAVTALVLLTGKEPSELLDPTGRTQPWQQAVTLSPEMTGILTQMLALHPDDRFASAEAVLHALEQLAVVNSPIASTTTESATVEVTEFAREPLPSRVANRSKQVWLRPLWVLVPLALISGAGWWWREQLISLLPNLDSVLVQPDQPNPLAKRAEAAGVDYGFLIALTDATFYARYPDRAGQAISDSEEDAKWRERWAEIADEWLTLLPQHLSSEARKKLGSYTEADRNQWRQQINQLYVGSRSLYDLTDAQFFHLFPDQRGKDFINQPIGQVWQAMATDQIQALQDGKTLERIEFEPGAFSQQQQDSLAVGNGRVYIANLAAGQIMRLNLQAPTNSSALSIYLPRPTADLPVLLEDAADLTWIGTLPQSGYYEIVVVNTASQPIRYVLNLAVDNVTSTPIEPKQGEAPEAKN